MGFCFVFLNQACNPLLITCFGFGVVVLYIFPSTLGYKLLDHDLLIEDDRMVGTYACVHYLNGTSRVLQNIEN